MSSHAVADRGRRFEADPIRIAVWAITLVLVGVGVYFAIDTHRMTNGAFFTWLNMRTILTSVAYVGVFSVATTIIMISGNLFSLSLGTTGAVTATTFLWLIPKGIVAALLATIALGVAKIGRAHV